MSFFKRLGHSIIILIDNTKRVSNMSSFDNIREEMNNFVNSLIKENAKLVSDEQQTRWPLDWRALPNRMYITDDALIVPKTFTRVLNYYGGFEYVDAEHCYNLGEYVMFSAESERVQEVLEALTGIDY